jgi:hypothetical protein
MFRRNIEEGRWDCRLDGDERWYQPINDGPMKLDGGSRRCNLRVLVRPNLCPAATRLRHLSAVAVHGAAAGALLMAHRSTGNARHDGGSRGEQKQERDDAGQALHTAFSISLGTLLFGIRSSVSRATGNCDSN